MGLGHLWCFLMGFVFPNYMCWGPAFLEVDKHLPMMGCGELISYFAFLAQSKLFSLFLFWFSPLSPCRALSVHLGRTYLSAEVKLPQQPSVCLAFITTRVQSWLMIIDSRHTPRTFSATLFPTHQSQHWCRRFFLSGWTSRLSLLNFQGLYWLICVSLLATLNGTTFLQYTSSFPQFVVIHEPAEEVRCGSLNSWNRCLREAVISLPKLEVFRSTRQAPQQTDLTFKLNVILTQITSWEPPTTLIIGTNRKYKTKPTFSQFYKVVSDH